MDERKVFSVLLIVFASVFVYSVFFFGTPHEQISGEIVTVGETVPSVQPRYYVGSRLPRQQQTGSGSQFGNQTNQTNTTAATPQLYPSSTKRVFVTSTLYTAHLGGYNGGVQKCAQRAAAAGLGGQWVPWLSILTNTTLIHARTMIPDARYVLLNGRTVAVNKVDLTDGMLSHAIDFMETHQTVPPFTARVWTGTRFNGLGTLYHCDGWTVATNSSVGTLGAANVVNQAWTDQTTQLCGGTARLYCFEI